MHQAPEVDVVRLRKQDCDAAARCLTRAFMADPLRSAGCRSRRQASAQ